MHINRRSAVNLTVLTVLFLCYSLKFMWPHFYAVTDRYAGLFVFICELILFFNVHDPYKAIKRKDRDLIILAALLIIAGVNLIVVDSGFGAYFTAADFILIFYLSDKIRLSKNEIRYLSSLYMLMLIIWLVFVYPPYFGSYDASFALNTNGAATFSVYTGLCAFVLLWDFFDRHEIFGLISLILFVRLIRLALWHRARGAFIILVVFMFLFFVLRTSFLKSRTAYTGLIILSTLGSLAFVALYAFIGRRGFNMEIPLFYKDIFSGRENIWYEFFEYFKEKPLTGIGTNLTIESFFEFNVHNAMYDILVIHGIIVFAGTLYFIFKRLISFRQKALNCRLSFLALCILLSVFFESYIDVDLIWADYAMNLIFLLSVISSGDEEAVQGQDHVPAL